MYDIRVGQCLIEDSQFGKGILRLVASSRDEIVEDEGTKVGVG